MEHLVLDYIWITLRGLTKHRIQPTNISPCVYTPWPPPNLPGCTHGPRTHLCDYIHVTCYRCRFKKKKKRPLAPCYVTGPVVHLPPLLNLLRLRRVVEQAPQCVSSRDP